MTAAHIVTRTDIDVAIATPCKKSMPTKNKPKIERQTISPANITALPEVFNEIMIDSSTE
ncbi:unannotated protein [freshwater metagenome]|uniref:Unannotated protein n=1 Tax=freshwater metagenome TaxID=449393 RepID=A0A6J7IV46_9ZZZZ